MIISDLEIAIASPSFASLFLLLAHKICCWILFVVFLVCVLLKPANGEPANTAIQWEEGGGVLLTAVEALLRGEIKRDQKSKLGGNRTEGQTRFIQIVHTKYG